MNIRKLLLSTLYIAIISAAIIGCAAGGDDGGGSQTGEIDCSDGLDNDSDGFIDCDDTDCEGETECPSCQDIVDQICGRYKECGLTQGNACVQDYLLNNLNFDCSEFLDGPYSGDCKDDIDNFSCNLLQENNLPQSCGDEYVIPEGIEVPPGACEDVYTAECERVVECNESITIDQCLLFLLFRAEEIIGIDCNDVIGGPGLNQCIIDLNTFSCNSINNGLLPMTCTGVIVPN